MTFDRRYTEGLLFTDFYQLTMAQLYFREGLAERRSQFDYFFRRYTNYGRHQAGYAVLLPNVRGSAGYGKAYSHLDDVEKRMDSVADLAHAVLRRSPTF